MSKREVRKPSVREWNLEPYRPSIFAGDPMKGKEALRRYERYQEMGYTCVGWSIGPLIGAEYPEAESPPRDDHGFLFAKGDKIAFYLNQPYGIGEEDIWGMIDYARRWGLQFDINAARSCWYPGRTEGIMFFKDRALTPKHLP